MLADAMKRNILKCFLVALCAMQAVAVHGQSEGLSLQVMGEAAKLTAIGLCMAKQDRPPFKELLDKRYSEADVALYAWKYAGIKDPRSIVGRDVVTIVENQKRFSSQLDSNCNPPAQLVFIPPAAAQRQEEGLTWMQRSARYRQECIDHLSRKYGVYSRGQLSTCVSNLSIHDYSNGR